MNGLGSDKNMKIKQVKPRVLRSVHTGSRARSQPGYEARLVLMSDRLADRHHHVEDEERERADDVVAVQCGEDPREQETWLSCRSTSPALAVPVGPQQDPAGARLLLHSTGAVQVLLPWKRGS